MRCMLDRFTECDQVVKEQTADARKLHEILLADLKNEVRAEGMEYQVEWLNGIPPDPQRQTKNAD